MKVKVSQIDEQLGVLLPDELSASLGWRPGDILEAEVEGNSLNITRVETAMEHGMRLARRAMNNYRGALQALAKE